MTGAVNPTKIVKRIIEVVIIKIFIVFGRYLIRYVRKTINIVILNQETAIKWVNHELLKSCFKSSGRDSLAHNKIHHKNIASSFGYISYTVLNSFFLVLIIVFSILFILLFHIIS